MTGEETTKGYLRGLTSRWIAGIRAIESSQEDRLFNDSLAAALAGEDGLAWAKGIGPVATALVIRHRYFDDFLQHASEGNA